MRGSLSLKESEPGWRNMFRNRVFSRVVVDGVEAYRLKSSSNLMGYDSQISLRDINDKLLKIWVFKQSINTATLDITQSPKLTYIYNYNPNNPYFITPNGEIPATLQLVGKTRRFELDGMEFKHKDYESVIHFRCPEKLLYQTILIADLLFTPPIFGNS